MAPRFFNLKMLRMIVPLLSVWLGKDAGQTRSGAKDFGCASAVVVKIEGDLPLCRLLEDK
jgi:hypothetical protein